MIFYGGDGYMVLSGAGFTVYKGEDRQVAMEEKPSRADTQEHMENFLAAVRSRKHTDLTADVEVGAKSMELVHLANISYRVKRAIQYDPATMTIKGNPEVEALTRNIAPYLITDNLTLPRPQAARHTLNGFIGRAQRVPRQPSARSG